MVTAAVPVEDSVTVCVVAEFTFTLPKAIFDVLTPSVGIAALSWSAKVWETLPAVAVSVTDTALPTDETLAEKLALVAPEATVTEVGTVTAALLLVRLTANPPVDAAEFSDTVHVSVPAPVMEELVQEIAVSTGVPVPLKVTTDEDPVEELLARVNCPDAAPALVGSNFTVRVAV